VAPHWHQDEVQAPDRVYRAPVAWPHPAIFDFPTAHFGFSALVIPKPVLVILTTPQPLGLPCVHLYSKLAVHHLLHFDLMVLNGWMNEWVCEHAHVWNQYVHMVKKTNCIKKLIMNRNQHRATSPGPSPTSWRQPLLILWNKFGIYFHISLYIFIKLCLDLSNLFIIFTSYITDEGSVLLYCPHLASPILSQSLVK